MTIKVKGFFYIALIIALVMKKYILLLLPVLVLSSCFEDVDNSLNRDKFIGNFDFTLTCAGGTQSNDYIIFIERPVGGADSLKSIIIIRNLLNQNKTISAVVSQNDIILNDSNIIGTGSLSENKNEITLSIFFNGNDCSGVGTRRL